MGKYLVVTLARVRNAVFGARQQTCHCIDPIEAMRAEVARAVAQIQHTFEAIAREWFDGKAGSWALGRAKRLIQRLEVDVFPRVGTLPIADISAPELLTMLRQIEARGAMETAHPVRVTCGHIFR